MILERVLKLYETEPDLIRRRAPRKGNPTASSVGNCLAQLQMLRFPELTSPEPRPIRSAWVLEDGDLHATDLKAKIMRAFPNLTGLSEELFYFGVPVTVAQREVLQAKIERGQLWGMVRPGFVPPRIGMGQDGGKDYMRLAERDPRDHSRPRPIGFVIDPGTLTLWTPLYVDHVVRHPVHGLAVVEFKSMSRFAFRHALLGEMERRNRMQLAMIGEATQLNAVWFVKCKDTAHLLEIAFLRGTDKTEVLLTKTSGQQERFLVPKPGLAVTMGGEAIDLQENETWDVGQIWTPQDPGLIEEIQERILSVLLFDPHAASDIPLDLRWMREFGPNFVCKTCDGTGMQVNRKDGSGPLKKPQACPDCGATGKLDEVELPAFPCGYCPVIKTCWGRAQPRLEISDKPRWYIRRDTMEASGLAFLTREEAP